MKVPKKHNMKNNIKHTRSGVTQKKRLVSERKSGLYLTGLIHYYALCASARRLLKTPVSSMMTILVMAVAMSLAGGFYVGLNNAQQMFDDVQMGRQISLYLHDHINDEQAMLLAGQLRNKAEVAEVDYISKQQALEEFQVYSGFGDALNALTNNPLPRVILIYPNNQAVSHGELTQLVDGLQNYPAVEFAQMDMQWVSRLQAMMLIVRNFIHALTGLLVVAVLLVTGNSIRLELQTRRDEILIEKLVGANNAYIYRPFLYTGFWYGSLAGILAWLIVTAIVLMLEAPIERLSSLYNSQYQLNFMDLNEAIIFIVLSTLLGIIGAFLAANQQIRNLKLE